MKENIESGRLKNIQEEKYHRRKENANATTEGRSKKKMSQRCKIQS